MKLELKITVDTIEEMQKITEQLTDQQENNNPEPTDKQLNLMKKLKIPIPDGLTKQQASDMIDQHFKKEEKK